MEEAHIFVSGIVQGVGFRAAVKRHAIEHRIKGYVRNLDDGRVEICAQGTSRQIASFLQTIRDKPGAGRLDQLDAKTRKVSKPFSTFEVL